MRTSRPIAAAEYSRPDAASVPAAVPYLTASAERRAAVRASFSSDARALRVESRVGGQQGERERSKPVAAARRTRTVVRRRRHRLAFAASSARTMRSHERRPPRASCRCLRTIPLDGTAAIISELDLVISVDTSIAHLAGALARPLVVITLPFAPGWRWRLGSDREPVVSDGASVSPEPRRADGSRRRAVCDRSHSAHVAESFPSR